MADNLYLHTTAMGTLKKFLNFTQIRFKCSKPNSGKSVDLASSRNSSGAQVVKFFTRETTTFPQACGSFDVFPDDKSDLSKTCSQWGLVDGTYATGTWGHPTTYENRLITAPFFTRSSKHFSLHWNRWECDDYTDVKAPDDEWEIFVR